METLKQRLKSNLEAKQVNVVLKEPGGSLNMHLKLTLISFLSPFNEHFLNHPLYF